MTRSASDPARTLSLLWGASSKPSRRGITVEGIVAAAVEIADELGAGAVEALTMRAVAARLGVGTMSLYGHVPGKPELVVLMYDRVHAGLYSDVDEPRRAGDWRAGTTLVAHRNAALLRKHPWLLDYSTARPIIGPNTCEKYEAELRPLDGIGLDDVAMDAALATVLGHVRAAAEVAAAGERAERESGIDDAAWWTAIAPILGKAMAGQEFPVSDRVGTAVGAAFASSVSADNQLEFGLAAILDGIAARLG